jgi:endonuclease V-like protein UPF0215 family
MTAAAQLVMRYVTTGRLPEPIRLAARLAAAGDAIGDAGSRDT